MSRLRLRVGGADIGRFGVMADGQSRCGADVVGSSPNADFYQTDVVAGTIAMKLNQLPVREYFLFDYFKLARYCKT